MGCQRLALKGNVTSEGVATAGEASGIVLLGCSLEMSLEGNIIKKIQSLCTSAISLRDDISLHNGSISNQPN